MNDLPLIAAQNTVVAFALAILVYGLTRKLRNPPLAHALWLLVLLKLVAPPVLRVDWSVRTPPESPSASQPPLADFSSTPRQVSLTEGPQVAQPSPKVAPRHANEAVDGGPVADVATVRQPVHRADETVPAADVPYRSIRAAEVVLWCWGVGSAVCALLIVSRIVRFERAVREMLPAPESLEILAAEAAGKLGLRRVPAVRCTEGVAVPLLWCVGRPTIVLPSRLIRQLDGRQITFVLAHELAHLRRRDHWVRMLELLVTVIYWWNPLLRLIRQQIHEAEDLCCDAWVRSAFPDGRRSYAGVVFTAAESLSASSVGPHRGVLPASPFLRSLSLKERIEMILESRFKPRVSLRSKLLIVLAAATVLPTCVRFVKAEAAAADENKAAESTLPARSEFPYVVKFEQGATKFLEGDKISILEVRGTAETFEPGEIYWIKGTYTLASRDEATLAAYTTAKHAADGTSKSYRTQTTKIKKGSGDFTLFLPMACEGWPHVSFYPSGGGEGFGGNYFGTGETVLKRWWGSTETDPPAKDKPAQQGQATRGQRRAFGRVTDGDGRPLAGVEIVAHCGPATLRRVATTTSGEDGRYELDFIPNGQVALISARKAGCFEGNLNRQGNCAIVETMPDESELKGRRITEDRVFLPERPLEIDFVMQPAARAAGRLVDEQGRPLAGSTVSLKGPELPPGMNVMSDAQTDEQGRFTLDGIPTTFRYQFVVWNKSAPKQAWASAALKFIPAEQGDLHARFGDREIRIEELAMRVAGNGAPESSATRIAGNRGLLNLTVDDPADVLEQSDARLTAQSAVLTLSTGATLHIGQSLIGESVPASPAVALKTQLARGRPDDAGEFVISFQNPPGFDLTRGKHQVIFQVFVGVSQRPLREKIFRQLEIEEGRYEVPVTISSDMIDDSRVSLTFVTIQPNHDDWVRAFFHEGKGTTYRGIWTSDGDLLPAIPWATPRNDGIHRDGAASVP
ncbi:MAG TPA: M56 family metallopeptidase [Pirellulales bacterium]|nr:M56 family metallopeptidase [Pirellulales bacterium]